jgi:hypothetical protein
MPTEPTLFDKLKFTLHVTAYVTCAYLLLIGYGLYCGVEIRFPAASQTAQQALDVFDGPMVADNSFAPVEHHKRGK